MISLLQENPFPNKPPKFIRARYYLYQFTDGAQRKVTKNIWKRTLVGEYLSPLSFIDARRALGK